MNNKCLRCKLSTSPIRRNPSHSSEMVSQVIFGEWVSLLEYGNGDWVYVQCSWDNYKGWVDINQYDLVPMVEEKLDPIVLSSDRIVTIEENGRGILISCGSIIHKNIIEQNNHIKTSIDLGFNSNRSNNLNLLIKLADCFLGSSYLWGGRSVFGIDCSGFIQVLFGFINVSMPRDASQQHEIGDHVAFYTEIQAGDLAFFENSAGKIVHVGMMLNDYRIIHAYGSVRIDKLEKEGIFNEALNKITHKLRLIKRVF